MEWVEAVLAPLGRSLSAGLAVAPTPPHNTSTATAADRRNIAIALSNSHRVRFNHRAATMASRTPPTRRKGQHFRAALLFHPALAPTLEGDAPVLGTAFGRVIFGDRFGLAFTHSLHRHSTGPLRCQVLNRCRRTPL
jgi:hypothetical protein